MHGSCEYCFNFLLREAININSVLFVFSVSLFVSSHLLTFLKSSLILFSISSGYVLVHEISSGVNSKQ